VPTPTPTPTAAIPIRGVVLRGELRPDVVKELKDMGVNWLELVLWAVVTEEGELIPSLTGFYGPPLTPPYSQKEVAKLRQQIARTEEIMVQRIRQAHQSGFKVFLCTYHERMGAHHDYGIGLRADVDSLLEEARRFALKWASIAEENKVEMFAPRKELQMFIGDRKALEWDDNILPELHKVYHGYLVRGAFQLYHWSKEDKFVFPVEKLPADMSEWDYLGLDLYGNFIDTFEEWASYVERFTLKVRELKAKHGLKGAVFEELGYPHTGKEAFWQDKSMSADEILQRLYQVTFEAGAGEIEGFFAWEWEDTKKELPGGRQEYISPKKVFKHYFTAPVISKSYKRVNPAKGKFKILSGNLVMRFRVSDFKDYEINIQPISRVQFLKRIKEEEALRFGVIMDVNALVEYNRWYVFTLIAKGRVLQFFLDEEKVLDYVDPAPLPKGSIFIAPYDGEILLNDLLVEEITE